MFKPSGNTFRVLLVESNANYNKPSSKIDIISFGSEDKRGRLCILSQLNIEGDQNVNSFLVCRCLLSVRSFTNLFFLLLLASFLSCRVCCTIGLICLSCFRTHFFSIPIIQKQSWIFSVLKWMSTVMAARC